MIRFWFAFRKGLQYRKRLRAGVENGCDTVAQLDIEAMLASGIRVLAVDFDRVLSDHAVPVPNAIGQAFLEQVGKQMPGRVYILSNRPTPDREKLIEENYDGIHFHRGSRKKPYPDGIFEIAERADCETSEIAMIDDRLWTGCLAAVLAGAAPYLIEKAFGNWKDPREWGFAFLTWFERFVTRIF